MKLKLCTELLCQQCSYLLCNYYSHYRVKTNVPFFDFQFQMFECLHTHTMDTIYMTISRLKSVDNVVERNHG